jgi:hypothetical protein
MSNALSVENNWKAMTIYFFNAVFAIEFGGFVYLDAE